MFDTDKVWFLQHSHEGNRTVTERLEFPWQISAIVLSKSQTVNHTALLSGPDDSVHQILVVGEGPINVNSSVMSEFRVRNFVKILEKVWSSPAFVFSTCRKPPNNIIVIMVDNGLTGNIRETINQSRGSAPHQDRISRDRVYQRRGIQMIDTAPLQKDPH